MKKISLRLLVAVFLMTTTAINAQIYQYQSANEHTGLALINETQTGLELSFSIKNFTLADQVVDGNLMKQIEIPGNFLPNDEGAPNLPGFSRYVAIPQGSRVKLNVINYKTQTLENIELAPAPRIPLDTEKGPVEYQKDSKIYSTNAYYPADPFLISKSTKIRGVDVVLLGITPFQYNPLSKELLVYYDVEIELVFEGGNGHFGDDRLRSPWWDQIVSGSVLNSRALAPINYHEKRRLTTDTPDYDYVIITPDDPIFESWADSIKDFRTRQGIKTGVVNTTEIGGNTVSAIEAYVNNAYNTWTTAPSAVLLLGDYSTGSGGITSQMYTHPGGYGDFASDNKFADVSGNDLPDIVFARITANNAAQLEVMVSKFLNYERNPPSNADFYDHPITALGWQTERWFQICSEVVGGFLKNEQNKNPVRINAVYDGNPTTDPWSTATNTSTVLNYFGPNGLNYIPATPGELGGFSGGTAAHVVNAINDGSYLLQHRDHGYYGGWGEPAFNTSSINSLNNINNELPFIFSINCQTGAFHRSSESFAEKFHRHTSNGENSGALGLIAATEVSYSFVNDVYVWGVFDNLHPDFMPGYSAQFPANYVMPAFGNAAGKHFLYQSSWPYNSGSKQITYRLFHHHGDAFMTLFTELPQNLNVMHQTMINSGQTAFTVTANAGSFIALCVDGEIIGTAQGTGSPVSIAINPQISPAEIIVTVTKQNCIRYESTVEVLTPSGPYVVFDSYTISDFADNNGNGQIDYGENISLSMTVKNVGAEAVTNVSGTISCSDEYVTITDNTAYFGDIAPGSSTTVNMAYAFDVAQDVPDQHQATFTLLADDGSKANWESYFTITANAPKLQISNFTINDTGGNNNGFLDPGETATLLVAVENSGHAEAFDVLAQLTGTDPYISIETSEAQELGNMAAENSEVAAFIISANLSTPFGHTANLSLSITALMGISTADVIQINFADYCEASTSTKDEWIEQVLCGEINNTTGWQGGVADYTHISVNLKPEVSVPISIENGYAWASDRVTVWIDWNLNKELGDESNETFILANNGTGQTFTGNILAPAGQANGQYRMRIRMTYSSNPQPCGNSSYGEVEDYTVIINELALPVVDFAAHKTTVLEGEEIIFTDLSTNAPTIWSWAFPGGTPQTSTTQNPIVKYNSTGNYTVKLTAENASGSSSTTKANYITVVALPECAENTVPEDLATDIPLNQILNWNLVADAAGYKIFFGTDYPPTNIENGTDLENTLMYDPDVLNYETTYYWKIVAYNSYGEAINCDTWTFTTESEPSPQTHFAPVWTSPYNPMTIYVLEATVDEADLLPGDEIGFFDLDPNTGNEICVGVGILTETITNNNYLEVITSMDDGSIPGQANGFTPGHEMMYKFWNSSSGETTNISANFPYPEYNETYTSQGTAFVELSSTSQLTQTTPLVLGWNMVSFMVEPEMMDMMEIVQPLIDENLLYKMIDENGGSVFHLPFPLPNGQWANTIGDMSCAEGYYIKVNDNCNLISTGARGNLPMEIELVTGWNMIGYPCLEPTNALNVLQPLIDQDVLYKVIDENGGTVFHLPFPPPNGQWANTIGNFKSGEGYYIKVSEDITLTISEPSPEDLLANEILQTKTSHFQTVYENNPFMPMHFIINTNNNLSVGDEVAIFNESRCVGAAVYTNTNDEILIISASADDPNTEIHVGYTAGTQFHFRVWNHQSGVTIQNVNTSYISGDESFNLLGTSIHSLDGLATGTSQADENNFTITISPNPVKENAIILMNLPENGRILLAICDIYGNTFKIVSDTEFENGHQQMELKTKGLSSGYYLLKHTYTDYKQTEQGYLKFIVIK